MLRKPFLVACALAGLGAGSASAGGAAPSAPVISWRVENPFRYFKTPAAARLHRDAYEALEKDLGREPTPHEIEKKLEIESDGRGWVERLFPKETTKDIRDATHQDPCWHRERAACKDYINPKAHDIMAALPGVRGECAWSVEGSNRVTRRACAEEAKLSIPYPKGAKITARVEDREVASEAISVTDRLIVGMGDSFSSGEGNPDRAVRFDSRQVIAYDRSLNEDPWLVGYPAREGGYRRGSRPNGYKLTSDSSFRDAAADWLHRGCHRSLYSQHVQAALHLAIRGQDQHHAVTFVHLACTGAEIVEGLFYAGNGNEKSAGLDDLVQLPQISGASRAICGGNEPAPAPGAAALENPDTRDRRRLEPRLLACPKDKTRPIDLLLLSIGGNDIGFTGLVAGATMRLDKLTAGLAELVKRNPTASPAQARALIPALEHNYAELAKVLKTVLHIDDPRRVILTAYPMMSYGFPNQICAAGKKGMERSYLFFLNRENAARSEDFVRDGLNVAMRRAAERAGWTWVEDHRARFNGHGYCAAGGEDGDKAASILDMPRRWGGSAVSAALEEASAPKARSRSLTRFGGELRDGFPGAPWNPAGYSPDQYKPYMPRARWVRTPNDSFLTVNLHEDNVPPTVLNLTRFMAYGGAFHPTAEGHAVTAGAVVDKAIESGVLDSPR